MFRKLRVLAIGVSLMSIIFHADAAIDYQDFSFGSGSPFTGQITIGDTIVTLMTSNTEPFFSGFRDLINTDPAYVTFTFDRPVEWFALDISYVLPPDEFLTDFNIGFPDRLTGDLAVIDGVVTSTVPGDGGSGELIWTNLDTQEISFTIGNLPESTASPATAINGFSITPVPLPPAVWLFGSAIMLLTGLAKRKK